MFLLRGGAYMISSIPSGYFGNKMKYPEFLSLAGLLGYGLAFWFLGPVFFIPVKQ
jgi:hypothetical protein